MKNLIFSVKTIILVVFMGVGFVSCSSDDDKEKNDAEVSVSIVGTWRWDDLNDYAIITFKPNGTGSRAEYYYENGKEHFVGSANFDYTFNESSMILRMLFNDEVETWRVELLTQQKMVIDGEVYIRQ